MTLEDAFRISTTLAKIDALLEELDGQLREAGASTNHMLMAANARQSLGVLTDSLRTLGTPE